MFCSRFTNDAIRDYGKEENARGAERAIRALEGRLDGRYPAIIGGREVESGKWIASVCPARPDLVVGHVASCTRAQVDEAIAEAKKAWTGWARTDPEARAETLVRLAALIRRDRFDFVALLAYEIGKDWYEADAEIAEAIDFCEYYARLALRHFQFQPLTRLPNEDNCYYYIPLGVGAVISPWNFPLAILAGMTTAAVVSGNAVLVKPSSDTPVIASKLVSLAREAGIPDGVINLVPGGGGEIGDHLVTHPEIRFVSFTGSADVGLRIHEIAARPDPRRRWMTRYVSEMGGKDAIVVDETADLDAAAAGIVRSAFGFQGQKCSACSRAIVDRRVKDRLVEMLVEKAGKLPAGDPWEGPCVFTGPVANRGAHAKILEAIETGRKEARLVLGGHAMDRPGWFVAPTIFDGVESRSFLGQEEIFGPVLAVITVDGIDEALDTANDTRYGLTGAFFSSSIERIDRAKREFHCGNLYINRGCTGALVGVHPFGGFNLSGTDSKAGGPDYLMNFTQGKTTSERTTVSRLPGIGV
ncbi:MAG: L-glutamate gamma-semialdehyde dehydrogenase [Acidobacteriia bacterium]|nr:L-glutamate gamma-semialdehyde dehydrogenase [Terriglobia bacterium]